ncbi:MAG: NAD(P)H-dependent oxidoreductase [Pseudomonadota bacterium]
MNVLLIDAHPDDGRLISHLIDVYEDFLPTDINRARIAIRDLEFSPNLKHGYAKRTEWEPDIERMAAAIDACDHLVIAFPMWWGAEPAELKGLLDRMFLPGFAFAYHEDDPWWDKLLQGRSADVIITMDTPPFFLRFMYGNSIIHRWKKQVLGFVGFKPVRIAAFGPVKDGGADKALEKWRKKLFWMATSISPRDRQKKEPRLGRFLGRN